MKWTIRELKEGDHIRVKRPHYYHHGIYVGDSNVIHYCSETGDSIDHPELVYVRETSIDFFSSGEIVEVASLNLFELLYSRKREERIKIAKSMLGEGNYNFLHNNCETLANKCCYKKVLSSQIEDLKKTLWK